MTGAPRSSNWQRRLATPAALFGTCCGALLASCSQEPRATPRDAERAPNEPGAPVSTSPAPSPPAADLVDEARARGLDYVNRSGGREKRTILEANGAGVALLDLESDGDLDVVFSQGLDSLTRIASGPGSDLEVFLNDGRGHFARRAGPGLSGWWTGLASGDVDGDGRADLIAAGFGALAVCLQDASGKLVPQPSSSTLLSERDRLTIGAPRAAQGVPAWATSVALFDADRDGALDLYVCQYLEFDPLAPPLEQLGSGALAVPCRWKGHTVFCGPAGLVPQRDRLLLGNGDGSFRDVSSSALVGEVGGYALAVLPFDADHDGDTDLFVADDSAPNKLWINDGRGAFRDHGYEAGVAYSADGRAQAGMGAAAGDVDRDGLVDFAVTNFSDEPTELYLGSASGFARATYRYGLQRETRKLLSWSVHLVDLDADGWLELVQTNGHVYPQADEPNTGTSYGQPVTAWHVGPGTQVRALAPRGPDSLLGTPLGARGAACGDVDGDGAPDLVVARIDGPCALGMNRLGAPNHRLLVRCVGPKTRAEKAPRTPRDGMGARVVLVCGEGAQEHALLAEVQTAQGYQSSSSPWLHFGLGASTTFREMQVFWPSGRVERIPGGGGDRALVVREGEGVVESKELAR